MPLYRAWNTQCVATNNSILNLCAESYLFPEQVTYERVIFVQVALLFEGTSMYSAMVTEDTSCPQILPDPYHGHILNFQAHLPSAVQHCSFTQSSGWSTRRYTIYTYDYRAV